MGHAFVLTCRRGRDLPYDTVQFRRCPGFGATAITPLLIVIAVMPALPTLRRLLPLSLFLLAPHGASAHAIIVSSQPAAGATVAKDAVAIRLRFNSRIDHARSRLKLLAPDGAERTLIPATGSPTDELDADAKALAPGNWRLHWQVLSVDGHITRGDIPFVVH